MQNYRFAPETLGAQELAELDGAWRRCVGNLLRMTALAQSGHPGGSLSTLHALLLAFGNFAVDPRAPLAEPRDRILVSHGHISPGVYAVLAEQGFFPIEDALLSFRRAGTPFSGHVETAVPGVAWNTGNLGQGISAGVGQALACKLNGHDSRTLVLMGDGEQQKGQIAEARRFAVKFGLNRLIVFVDWNRLQISGRIEEVMPQDLPAEWTAAGFNVEIVEQGNDFAELYRVLRAAYRGEVLDPSRPTVVLARTTMGYGVPFMENQHGYHGNPPSLAQAREMLAHLGLPDDLAELQARRQPLGIGGAGPRHAPHRPPVELELGTPRDYAPETRTDCRSAYGNAMEDLARLNNQGPVPKVLAFCCDLETSVKLEKFHAASPGAYFESGIQEHHTAAMTSAVSREGFVPFFSTFGVFGVDETHNQNRLADINEATPKLVLTHCGLDVGEDGPTHQCIDFIPLVSSLFGFELYYPGDPNQCDRIIRTAAARQKPVMVCMGRSKVPVLLDAQAAPAFGGDYRFVPGRADVLRAGRDVTVLTFGPLLPVADAACRQLATEGIEARLLNMASLVPLDRDAVLAAARETKGLITVEDHNVRTGLGSLVAGVLADAGLGVPFVRLGVTDYGSSGPAAQLYAEQGLTAAGIVAAAKKLAGR